MQSIIFQALKKNLLTFSDFIVHVVMMQKKQIHIIKHLLHLHFEIHAEQRGNKHILKIMKKSLAVLFTHVYRLK